MITSKLFIFNRSKKTLFVLGDRYWSPFRDSVFPCKGASENQKTNRSLHQLLRTNKKQETINIYFRGDSTIWSDNKKELILHDKNYKKKLFNQLSVFKNFRKEEVLNLTRNHLSCDIFCVLEKDKKTELLESPLLVKEKESNKLEFCISKDGSKKVWIVDFVSSYPSGLCSPKKVKKEGYLWISEKDLNCEQREACNHNHSESVALYVLEQNKHLFIKLLENHTKFTIKAFGIKFFSLIDSCQHCSEEMHSFLKKVRSQLHHLVKAESLSLGYQSQKKVPFYILFYSWRPYNFTEYTIVDTSDQQKSVCKSLSSDGQNYFFENYSVIPAQDFLDKEELIANLKTIYSHIAVFEKSEQEKKLEELEKEHLSILKKIDSLDLEMKSAKINLQKVIKEKEQISKQIKKVGEELKIAKQKETQLESKIEISPKQKWSI